ncbi:unnamed protein product [Schistosoma turkestanicum]|nr:unnamed protein product [Schistosoma turkestanicum]
MYIQSQLLIYKPIFYMSHKSSLDNTCPISNSFICKLLKCWKDFRSACRTFCNLPVAEDYSDSIKKFTEDELSKVIGLILDHLMISSKSMLVNSEAIIAYYTSKRLLNLYKDIKGELGEDTTTDEQNTLVLNAFKKTFFSQLFFKVGCVLDKVLKEASETTKAFPICICIEFISDALQDNSSSLLLLHHLSELWSKLGIIVKKVVEQIMISQNGKATSDQEVFLFEILRLWKSALKACMTVDDKKMESTRDCAFTVLVDVMHVCLVEYFTKYSKFLMELSSSVWPLYFVRILRTVYKLVHKSDHMWVNTLHSIVNTLIYELLCSNSYPRRSHIEISNSTAFCGCLTAHIVHTIKAQKITPDEISLLHPDVFLSLRIIILCGLESALKLDPNDQQLWSIISSVHGLILGIELDESNTEHSYENSIITLFSEDDAQLFRLLDLWIQIEDHIRSTELYQETSLSAVPNAHWLFACLAKSVGFSSYLFVDWLVSPETTCLSYLVHYLRRLSTEDELIRNSNKLIKSEVLARSWPIQSLINMLSQISKSLVTLDQHNGIAFCPAPLINRINRSLSVLNSVNLAQNISYKSSV